MPDVPSPVGQDSSRGKRRPGRPVGDGANRDAILDAAKELFAARGYAGASMRAIAGAAGVDPGLIRHFFADKQGLFAATIADRSEIPGKLTAAFAGDPAGLGERLAAAYLDLWESPETGSMVRALFRTAFTSDTSDGLLHELLATRVVAALPDEIAGLDNPVLRVTLAGSHLLGVAAARNLAHARPLAELDRSRIVAIVAPTIHRYLTEPLPG
ncbi:TetR family transcriptional regulator [Gordonia sp. ABSL1-1]|uniref:TetR/AcrR family transcriptional regulator n=1 Tax=Gordonia sp. ABSL1-1 TaxID=3053923 RepID=UPI00257245B0|nr:TetR family transcriptional regulator [Gordonia sp. ABSL1-1]MDL9937832.1 TetR family transcriptional regulator [Gordonia sp. ABSL1-1]